MKRLIVVAVCAAGLAAWAAQTAKAWNSNISGSMACSGVVSWTATAWNGPAAERVNPDVAVSVSTDGGATFTQIATGAFTAADNYSFSGTWANPGAATSIVLQSQALANWPGGGGDVPGPATTATVVLPATCGGITKTTPPPAPQVSSGPNRTGYCDSSGRFWNLIVGQNTQPPYNSMNLTPADVTASGAQYCAAPPPPRTGYCTPSGVFLNLYVGENNQPPYNTMNLRPADVSSTGALYCAAPPVQTQAVKGATHTKKTHKVKHVKQHKVKQRVKAAKHAKTLPFTK